MDNPASIEDVEKRWGPIANPTLRTRAAAWLDDAWLKVKKIPGLIPRIESEAVDVEDVKRILCAMVVRVLKNPSGFRSRSIDDASVTIDTTISSGELYLSDEERDELSLTVPLSGFYSLELAPPYWGS